MSLLKKPKAESQMRIGKLNIRVIRTSRQSVALQVKPEGITMRSPLMCPENELQQFAKSKYTWLLERSESLQKQLLASQKTFQDGEIFKLFDQPFTLQICYTNATKPNFKNDILTITVSNRVKNKKAYIQRKLYEWYKQKALYYFQCRAAEIAKIMQMDYHSIKVRDYKARWGSCSSKGDLSFNWRIIMAPRTAIDSVIVHELAHLKHFNHSNAFWQLVHKADPNYKENHAWFNQHRLTLMF